MNYRPDAPIRNDMPLVRLKPRRSVAPIFGVILAFCVVVYLGFMFCKLQGWL